MLRFWIQIGSWLTAGFAVIGVLLSRPWGWSEYRSPELYVIYQQARSRDPDSFFLLNTNGSGEPAALRWSGGTVKLLACSPDARTLAFLTDSAHLYVVNETGIVYDRDVGQGYDALNTANNGTVALAKTQLGMTIVVSASASTLPSPPDNVAYDPLLISSSGMSLWSHMLIGGIKLVSPDGDKVLTLAAGTSAPSWLASEQIFTFRYYDQTRRWNGGLVDAVSHQIVWFRDGLLPYGILSPDATEQVFSLLDTESGGNQLFVVDPLTKQSKRQLTHDSGITHNPLCFLTFQPGMLTTAAS